MTVENFETCLKALSNRKPFQVYTIELNTGQRYEIDFPNATTWREGVAIFLAPGRIPVFFDHESVNQIVADTASTMKL